MSETNIKSNITGIYRITGLISFIDAGLLVIFAVYLQLFHSQSLTQGMVGLGISVLSELIWLGILFVFMRFLRRLLHFDRANSLFIILIVCLGIIIISTSVLFIEQAAAYSQFHGGDFNQAINYSTRSLWSVILMFVCNLIIEITCLIIGIQLLKINIVFKELFTVLGISFMLYGTIDLLHSVTLIDPDSIPIVIKAAMIAILGYTMKKVCTLEATELPSPPPQKTIRARTTSSHKTTVAKSTTKSLASQPKQQQAALANKPVTKQRRSKKEATPEVEEIPQIDPDKLENKDDVLNYYKNLRPQEISRLQFIVSKKYQRDLTEAQLKNLVLQHIAKEKLYDHGEFRPW